MFTRSRHVIAVRDLERSAAYYRDVLGFEVQWQNVAGWRQFVRDGFLITAGECADEMPAGDTGDHAYFAYVDVTGIDALHADLRDRGVDVIKPLRDEPWGTREFGIRTIDGYRMMFGEPLPAA